MAMITFTGFLCEVIFFHYLPEVIMHVHTESDKPSNANTTKLTARPPVKREVSEVPPL